MTQITSTTTLSDTAQWYLCVCMLAKRVKATTNKGTHTPATYCCTVRVGHFLSTAQVYGGAQARPTAASAPQHFAEVLLEHRQAEAA
jgi:hypothetical protein